MKNHYVVTWPEVTGRDRIYFRKVGMRVYIYVAWNQYQQDSQTFRINIMFPTLTGKHSCASLV